MKAGWQSRPFEDCIEKVTYTTKIQRKDFLDAGAFPVVSQEDAFINGYWDGADDVFRVETPLVIFGDHTKVLKYIDFDFVLGADGVKLLAPKEFLVPKFFYYQLQTAKLDSLGYARHYKLLKELEIKYPDRVEQHRIVAILDEAFDGIATAKANSTKNLQNARALFESHLQSVFTERGEGWVEKTLGDLCEATQGVQIPKSEQSSTLLPGYRRYLYISDFESDKNLKYVRDEHPKKLVTPDDIIVANTGSAGKIFKGIDGILSNNLFKVSFDPSKVFRDFIFFFVTSGLFHDYQRGIMRGAANPHMGHVNFKSTPISIPDIEIQKIVVARIYEIADETQRLESLYQQKLTALDNLKKSLLHQAFSGQL